MDKQIRQVCKRAFHQLHNIHSIRKFLDRDALQTLVHALVTHKLEYFNSLYSGLPVCQIMKLQKVQNAAARLVLRIPRCQHIIPGLKSPHWLPVEKKDYLQTLPPCLQDPALFGSSACVWFVSSICTGQTIEVGKSKPYGCAPSTDADIWESPLLCCCFSAVESADRLHQEAREYGGFQGFT